MAAKGLLVPMAAAAMAAKGFILSPVQIAPWNSTDMSHKYSRDQETQAKKLNESHALQAASRQNDAWLSGNQSILNIAEDQLRKAKSANVKLEKQIQDTKDKLQQAQEDLAEKKHLLEKSIENTTEANESLLHDRAAFTEAQKHLSDRRTANTSASANEAKAEAHLQQMVMCCPDQILAAHEDVTLKRKALASASEALAEAEKEEGAKRKAMDLAVNAMSAAVAQKTRDIRAYQDAVVAVEIQANYLSELTKQNAQPEEMIGKLEEAVEKLDRIVKVLKKKSQELREEVDAKKKELREISAIVDKDTGCISRLQTCEGQVELSTSRFEKAMEAYRTAPAGYAKEQLKAAAWAAKYYMELDANASYNVHEDCDPNTTELGPRPVIHTCSDDSHGSCHVLRCWAYRHAVCSEDHRCVCPAGTCAVDGVCTDRGSPVLLAGPSTEWRAEPVGASAVFLAAAALMMMALLVLRRRRREIRLPDNYFVGLEA